MIQNFKFDYDDENDSFFLYDPRSKSKGSIELDDVIIDFNNKKEIVGIEILNTVDFFANMNEKELKISKETLKNLKACKVDIITKSNFFVIKLVLLFENDQKLATTTLIPTIRESNPALAEVSE